MKQSILWVFLSLLLCANVTYGACKVVDSNGRVWATLTTTAKTIGTVATLKQCPTAVVYATPPVTPPVVCAEIPIQNKLCAAAATTLFDPTYQGMRLYVNSLPDQGERCLFLRPKATALGVDLQIYDATRPNADGTQSCNP